MGVTIHYTLITSSYETVLNSVKSVREYAGARYLVEDVKKKAYLTYSILTAPLKEEDLEEVRRYVVKRYGGYREEVLGQVPDEPPWPWIAVDYPRRGFYTYAVPAIDEAGVGRPVECEGVIVSNKYAEPFTATFYKIGGHYVCDGSTKTQPFTVEEVEPNIEFHKWVCHVLYILGEGGGWRSFYVSDEAGYWESFSEERILESFKQSSMFIYMFAGLVDKVVEGVGGAVKVGGRIDVRGMRKTYEEVYGGSQRIGRRQTSLDEFYNRGLEDEV